MATSNKDILEKAIQKAIDGGWRPNYLNRLQLAKLTVGLKKDLISSLIYDHDFAKALWGERKTTGKCTCGASLEGSHTMTLNVAHSNELEQVGWQCHLQMMVIADDPIAYLGEHLDD